MRWLRFSDSDLAANQAGYLSKAQIAVLEKALDLRRWRIIGAILLGLAGVCVILALVFGDGTLLLIGAGLGFFLALCVLYAQPILMKIHADLDNGSVMVREGKVTWRRGRRWDMYVDGILWKTHSIYAERFRLIRALHDGQIYRVYYAPNTKAILSVQSI